MRINSTDAQTTSQSSSLPVASPGVSVVSRPLIEPVATDGVAVTRDDLTIRGRSLNSMTDLEKRELPISDKVVIDAIERANKALSGGNRKFEFSVHEKTKQIVVKVVDSDTNEVIREIPSEKILDMVAKMWEMAGIMVDERR